MFEKVEGFWLIMTLGLPVRHLLLPRASELPDCDSSGIDSRKFYSTLLRRMPLTN